ncbi:MAG TPA: hypothetical protein VK813_10045 [Edaphobacter sp.]|nr:hypothetical protein [Edaphobacter sp.]
MMRIAGHRSTVVSQRHIHPTPDTVDRTFERPRLFGKGPGVAPKDSYLLQ